MLETRPKYKVQDELSGGGNGQTMCQVVTLPQTVAVDRRKLAKRVLGEIKLGKA